VKTSYFKELGMKKEVLERLEGLRMELRLLEKNEGSMTEVWKAKCRELVDICNKLKVENDSLRLKITQIAMNLSSYGGINGNDNESQHVQAAQSFRQSEYENSPFTLPKLMTNTQNRITSNF
jgi:regulator of replication initiation timing